MAGNALAQTDGQYVIKKIVASGETEVHYLAHVYNTTTSEWELQDATSFSPNCLWYSGPTFNLSGTHHNYYFFDGTNYRFLSAPLAPHQDLDLSTSLPESSDLKNTDEVYYFYDWDHDAHGAGVARGHEDGGTGWWTCHWVSYSDHYSQWMTTADDYYIRDSCARYREVTVTPHAMEVTGSSGGLSSLNATYAEMNYNDPTTGHQVLGITVNSYNYTYKPAYTTYVFEGETHNYYNGTDLGTNTPSTITSNGTPASSYLWTITGDGASYLSLDNNAIASPTLTYSSENTTGHKTATVTVTVTFGEGASQTTQTLFTTILVKTSCQNPTVLPPEVTFEDATLSWYPTAEKYKVEWKKQGTSTWNVAEVDGETSFTITDLEYEATYQYRVTAFCGVDYLDPPSSPSVFNTPEEPSLLVYGAVFGGGRMADVDGNSEVVVINCKEVSALYGGNDIAGKVKGADGSKITLGVSSGDPNHYDTDYGVTHADMKLGSVYGGGNGYYAYDGSSFVPATATTVDVASGASVKAMTPSHTVGDAVWTNTESTTQTLDLPSIVKTSITVNRVNNYQIKADSIFGGAKNAFLALTTPDYETDGSVIDIKGGTIFAVFGGNNFGGTQSQCTHRITIEGTDTSLTPNITNTATSGYGRDFGIRYVFGGGNKVAGEFTDITVTGGQTDTIFAGGNSADVVRGLVRVNCTLASGSGATFGNTYSNAIASTDGSTITVKTSGYAWNGTGVYNVRALFGGNNKAATVNAVPILMLTSGSVGTVYGGGNAGDMQAYTNETIAFGDESISIDYSTHVKLDSPKILVDYLYGGCQVSNVDYSTWVEIKNGHVGTVYGGCNISGDVGSTRVFPDIVYSGSLSNEDKVKYQTVKGATYVKATGGTIYKDLFAGSNGYYHCNDGIHYVSGMNFGNPAYDPNELYVGLPVPTHNETRVHVSQDDVEHTSVTVKGNVYAGGNLACVGYTDFTASSSQVPQFVGWASVQMDGGTVEGDVYGGGNMASVYGSNEVKVSGGTIGGGLYGGNDRTGQVAQITNRVIPSTYEYASDGHTSLSKVKTYVGLTGTPNIGTVYGGGNGAYDYSQLQFCGQTPDQPLQSNTFVDINIDPDGQIGTVYGGGNGVTVLGTITVFLNVNGTTYTHNNVDNIFGGNNMGDLTIVPDIILLHGQVGNIYGGCNQGAMNGKKTVESYENIGSYVHLPHQYTITDNSTNPPTTLYTDNNLTAVVTGAIYGGCRMNGVANNTLVLIEKGDLRNVGIFGGCDISGTVSGTSQVVTKAGLFTDIYGGGNGNYDYTNDYPTYSPPYSTYTHVDMVQGGTAENNVYAGGYAGECGDTYVEIGDNGRVEGSVFGGGNMAGTTHTSTVVLNGGVVLDGVYGGCNNSGDIGGDIQVNIQKGTVGATGNGNEANIYGGGYGAGTTTSADIEVNIGVIDATSASECPVIYGDVYGGSALGSVNDGGSDQTTVNFLNGTLHGNVYGGGLGDPNDAAKGWVNGQVVVNIGSLSQATANCFIDLSESSIFGCNNTNGSPQDDVTVNIYNTAHTTENSYPNPVPTVATELEGAISRQFALQAVYGGGNLADYAPENGNTNSTKTTLVHVYQCDQNTIKDVYGGSNRASAQNTHVVIDGGRIDRTFGGGNGVAGPAPVVGTARTEINAGLITQVFGGSNNNGNIGNIELEVTQSPSCPELINEVFSGSNQASLYGNVETNLIGECYDPANPTDPDGTYYYGGTNLGTVYGNVTLNVYSGYYVNVFGGSKGFKHQTDPTQNISADIKRFPTSQEVTDHPDDYSVELKNYLATQYAQGNDLYGTGGNVTLNIYGGKIENAFGGSDVLGDIEGKITVNVLEGGGDALITHCDLDLTNVYGGGNETEYNPKSTVAEVGLARLVPEVNVKNGNVKNNVFGGGKGRGAIVTANPVVTIGNLTSGLATIFGNVYGGGELAQVAGNTKVLVQKDNTIVRGTVYGGGKGSTSNVNDGLVTKNTLVQMTGGQVQRSIYGGGELGSVGTFTAFYVDGESEIHVAGEPKTCQSNTGLTEVRISGGKVGLSNGLMPDPSEPASNDDYGYVFCASKGLTSGENIANLLAASGSSYLEISGTAVITASAYGGSENGQVLGNTHVKVTGGQIGVGHYKDANGHHWDDPYTELAWNTAIAKVKDGSFTDADAATFHVCDAWPFRDEAHRYVYDYYANADGNYVDENGNVILDGNGNPVSSNGGSNRAGDGHSFFGHVFGGGSGYYPYAPGQWRRSAGRVCGNTWVEITGGHILTNVYGGNEITDVIGQSKVEMTGGTLGVPRRLDSIQARPVNCNLFGAGMGDPRVMFNQWSNVGSSVVLVGGDAVVFGSVFGGGEDGHVLGDASTTITDNAVVGTFGSSGVDGNTFGGGRGFSGIALTAGVVCGNITLNVSESAHILGSVFGGGRLAAVGTYLRPEDDELYGVLQPGNTHGNITINITGGTIGNLSQLTNNRVYSIGDVFGGSKGTLLKDVAHNQRLGLVKNTTVNISQPSGKTTLIYGSVYGGGEIASVGGFNYATSEQVAAYNATHPSEPLSIGDVYSLSESGTGSATVNITGGTIGTNDFVAGAPTFHIYRGNVFGSCLGKAGSLYSGYSFVDQSHVTINGGTVYGSVFGGGENGHVLHDTDVKIQNGYVGIRIDNLSTPIDPNIIYRGNVYGGGRGIDEVTVNSGTYSITAGKVSGNTNVSVTGGTVYRNVYGGGSLASVGDPDETPVGNAFSTGLATVSITGGQVGTDGGMSANDYTATPPTRDHLKENGFVYGSGRGVAGTEGSQYISLAYVKNTEVTIGGTAYVTGSVFGGGENGHVRKNTNVTVEAGTGFRHDLAPTNQDIEANPVIGYPLTIDDLEENLTKPRIIYRGNVYGGGRGIDHNSAGNLSKTAGVVKGNTTVSIEGGTIRHDVYGGGSMASVGTYTYDGSGNVTSVADGTGLATVEISGGKIGIDTTLTITQVFENSVLTHNLSGINNGQVFGGGRGESGALYKNLAYVDTTHVYIHGGTIYGAVFGGGCNGHVKEGTYVQMTAGTIGHSLTATEKEVNFLNPTPIYFGNVYGGGRGIDHANLPGTLSLTAGVVYRNTKVEISGGRVHHDVYGGGSLAIVAGSAHVIITGTAIIGTDGQNAGYVYGSGRGMAGDTWSDMAYVNETHVTIGTNGGSDNPQVRASVFGGGSNGHVEEDTDVKIYTGTIGTPLTTAEMVEADPNTGTNRPKVYRGNVYGGGRGVERSTTGLNPELSATAGRVFGNTNVEVNGGTIYHNIYGGGSLASVGTFTVDATGHHFTDGTGTATVTINGGIIGMSSDVLTSLSLSTNYSGLNNGQVYGSGRGEAGASYSDFAFVNNTYVNVNGGSVLGAVFGGGANGHVKADTHVTVDGGTVGIDDVTSGSFSIYRGNVYGGGRGIDLDGSSVSPTAGKVYGNTNVEVSGGTVYHNVFGGGSLASVGTTTGTVPNLTFADGTGTATVTVNGGTIGINANNNGRVYGSGRGYPKSNLVDLTYVKNTFVYVQEGANINGCVFGSGDNGQVYNDTRVVMTGGTVGYQGGVNDGNLFGGGRGQDTDPDGNMNIKSGKVHNDTYVTMQSGTVKGNIYGGGNMSSVAQTTHVSILGEETHIGVGGYSAGGNVFGAGRGDASHRDFAEVNNTIVSIAGDPGIQNNVYGGGEIGAVAENTDVTVTSGTLKNVYGAGRGTVNYNGSNANIGGYTQVTVNNGTIDTIFGGGENGTVRYAADGLSTNNLASRVNLNGGVVKADVFGGGNQGTTQGRVIVNMTGGTVRNEVFGGAKGVTNRVFVAGLKTVNVHGGTVFEHVYGGSRDANDGMDLNANSSNSSNANVYTAFVNVSGGMLRGDVYGAGYFGTVFGSTDVNIGTDAINNDNPLNIDRNDIAHAPTYLHIIKSVYAGSNWGEYDPHNNFQSSTTTGHSNIFVDGNGYDTQTLTPPADHTGSTYMDIGGSLYGSGTSGDAGTQGRKIQVANYGTAITGSQTLINFTGDQSQDFTVLNSSTRSLQSVQRCDTLIFDNVSVKLTGQGDISQNFNTVEYSITYVNNGVYVRNGSNIVACMQIDEIHSIHSEYRPGNDLYANPSNQTVYWIGIGDSDYSFHYLTKADTPVHVGTLPSTAINTIRFDGGYSMYVHYTKNYAGGTLSNTPERFGEIHGFFRMVTETLSETFAYARPKITGTRTDENQPDGGFMSYYNTGHNTFTDAGSAYTKGKQFPYENVLGSAKSDRPDYRYWRIVSSNTGNQMVSPMAFFLYSDPANADDFITIERTITLPTLTCSDAYFVLSNIDFGDHVHLVNAAIDNPNDNNNYWIVQKGENYSPRLLSKTPASTDPYYDMYQRETNDMRNHPNNYFGLVLYPDGSLTGVANPSNSSDINHEYLLSMTTKEMLTQAAGVTNPAKFYYPSTPNGQMAKVTIRLTYYKEMTMSLALSPITIELKSYCGSETDPTDIISIPIYITTQTALGQDMSTTTYAMFGSLSSGNNPETYNVKATMPPFNAAQPELIGKNIPFYIYDLSYSPSSEQTCTDTPDFLNTTESFHTYDYEYAMVFKRGFNSDNKSGWREAVGDATNNYFAAATPADPILLGTADGRNPFSIDFTLYYNSCKNPTEKYISNKTVGTMTFSMCYPITLAGLNGTPDPTDTDNWKSFDINVTLYKRNTAIGFYLDGIKGNNTYSGAYADCGKLTLQGVLDNDWKPGDKIYVVRPIKITSATTTWTKNDGATITLYRYPGAVADPTHTQDPDGSGYYQGAGVDWPGENTGTYDSDLTDPNNAIVDDGAIFANISGSAHLTLDNVILDGYSAFGDNDVIRPLIKISDGGSVVLQNGSGIRNGNVKGDDAKGGAVYLGNGGSLVLMNGVAINDNNITNATHPGNGAGIYLDKGGNLTVGGLVNITHNKVNGEENNVYLHVEDDLSNINEAVVNIGETGLDAESRIGVYKDKFILSGDLKDLTPIAQSLYIENIQRAHTNKNFVDDTRKGYTHYFVQKVLYYGKTWAHFVTSAPTGFDLESIDSEEDLAWFLSYVNGLNGSEVHADARAVLTNDIDMGEHYWKPIGIIEDGGCPNGFVGTFDGQWHTIDGLVIRREGFENIGLFDNVASDGTNNGVIKNLVAGFTDSNVVPWNPDEVEQYAGGIVGSVLAGGVVTACESNVNITAADATTYTYLGGVAGRICNGGTVHSVMAKPTLTGYSMGGIVGKVEAGGNLVNSFSNIKSITSLNISYGIGGLVGRNRGRVENCYSQLQCAEPASQFGWFVGNNTDGTVRYCYSPQNKNTYVYQGTKPSGHGNYGSVLGLKDIGYLYDDNKIILATGETNTHYSDAITYTSSGQIDQWSGMLGVLNHWVKTENSRGTITYTPWYRPLTPNINNDLPVLGLPDFNTVASLDADPNTLVYGNLDNLLTTYNAGNEDASLLVYQSVTGVTNVPDDDVKVFVNEDVALLQASNNDFKANVGVTFDNSSRQALNTFGALLSYDWHLMSTSLSDAKIGATYSHSDGSGNYTPDLTNTFQESPADINGLVNSYFPNGLAFDHTTEPYWDFYCYYEPEYHWINLKRNKKNHFHNEAILSVEIPGRDFQWDQSGFHKHYRIYYEDPSTVTADQSATTSGDNNCLFIPGKGYMMAISQDSYMNSTGTLNRGAVTIKVTNSTDNSIPHPDWSTWPSYDWGSNLVGNPYQAYLDLDLVSTTTVNPGLDKFWVYDADVKEGTMKGLYKPYTKGASQNPAIPSRYIHPHQGFFVVYTPGSGDPATKDMTFNYNMATATTNEYSYYRNDDDGQPKYPLVNLYVRDTVGNTDIAIVEFNRPELGGVPKVNNLRNADFKLYARMNNEDYGLLFTPEFTERVPLFFKTPDDGTYTLSWERYHGNFASMLLIDNITGAQYDMLHNDSYTFEAHATDYAARFYIVFSVTDVDEQEDVNEPFVYYNGYGWVVDGQGQLELVDMLGHVLYTNYLGGEQTLVHFDGIAAGMYLLRLVDGSRLLKAQKIVIKN